MKGQVLLIIDVQERLFKGPPSPYDAEKILGRLNDLPIRARAAGVPVIFVQHSGTAEDGLEPGSSGWQLHRELKRDAGDVVIQKKACDAFYGTQLGETLKRVAATLRNIVSKLPCGGQQAKNSM